jgi:hypothetical protein
MDERIKRLKGNKLCKDVRQSPGFDMLFAACGSVLAFGSEKKGVEHQAPTSVQDTPAKCQINTVYVCIYHFVKRVQMYIFLFFFVTVFELHFRWNPFKRTPNDLFKMANQNSFYLV